MHTYHLKTTFYIVLATCLLTAIVYFFQPPLHKEIQSFNIAMIVRNDSYHNSVTKSLIKAMYKANNKKIAFNTRIYVTESHNKILTTAITENILSNNFDMMITIGAAQCAVAHSVNQKRDKKIPQICIGGGNLVKAKLITSNETPGGNVTGVSGSSLDPIFAFKLFYFLKPQTKRILIPYCPHASHGDIEQDALTTAQEAQKHGIETVLLSFEKTSEVIQKIRHLITDFDAIFCLEGDIIEDAQSSIGKLCSEHHVTFFARTLGSSKENAAVAFGVDSKIHGTEAFEYVWRILVNGENPGDLPIKFVDNARRIAINRKLCVEQDLPISPLLELCLSRGVVY